ncbi:MAG: MFS transporter [Thermoleophilia bacterium]|nr:MFS transporter [Thermoleophilia bacterium]
MRQPMQRSGPDPLARARSSAALAAGLVVGSCLTWNVTNVGAAAHPLADHYGVALASVGLLTGALFLTHLLVQLPAGRAADRLGARSVALVAAAAALLGNVLLLLEASFPLALGARALVGIGSGAGFVAGVDLVRAGGGGPRAQGLYGGATLASGGLALMLVPWLTDATGWRAPFSTAALLAGVAGAAATIARGLPRVARTRRWTLWERDLVPIGLLQAATFGLVVVAGNWVVPLLERRGVDSAAAGLAGGLVLFAGVASRPLGGILAQHRRARTLVGAALLGMTAGAVLLALDVPYPATALAALLLGAAAGFPFATIFAAAQRARPDAPAAAIAFVNSFGVLTILGGTPLAGLAFSLPGDGAVAFVSVALLAALALVPLQRAPL